MKILHDIRDAVTVFGLARKTRNAVEIRTVRKIPVIRCSYWAGTMEWHLLRGETEKEKAVKAVFATFTEPVQHGLTFVPKRSGGWVDRARFWQRELKPALPPEMYHKVMVLFIGWYIHCLRRKGAAA